ncbi:MAG: iron permease [Burkholderiales bacterium RIFCSPLOWO2_02_FULL_57_36]|nr:MAG: iron permease [Burkholderiales bacterium RIFCSPLOWO2_02_FULL_57_36]
MKPGLIVFFRTTVLLLSLISSGSPALAMDKDTENKAKQIWQMLDYVAVDYSGAVKNGQVISDDEYAEMLEFSQTAERQIRDLPETTAKAKLAQDAGGLRKFIADKASVDLVAEQARGLASALLAAYPIPLAPAKTPDLKHGSRLYQAQCASCHGVQGKADGPLAAVLNPPPIAFADRERASERSVFSLYQTTTRGVEGTAMLSFATLSEDDRWSLAFFASTLAYTDDDRQLGEKFWKSDKSLHAAVPEISALTQASEAALARQVGPDAARGVLSYLRSHPEALAGTRSDPLSLAKTRLRESLAAVEKGDNTRASALAISAYLDGFEPVEPRLAVKNHALFENIERTMGIYRASINEDNVEKARNAEQQLQSFLSQAQDTLSAAESDPVTAFLSALTILLREGLEALLIVIAMIAFLKKADRRDALPYVHAGWMSALAAGGATWAIATYLVDVSGASREITEGFAAIFAAIVLLTVGIWMHQKSLAGRWQAYVKQKLTHALNKRSLSVLFVLSFVTVYREVFETILFFAALWTERNGFYLFAGLVTGIVILAVIAVAMLYTTARLPIAKFFGASSALIAVLSVVLIGKGVAALQEAGLLDVTPVSMPRIDLLGLYPSQQTLIAQMIVVLVIALGFAFNIRSQKPEKV